MHSNVATESRRQELPNHVWLVVRNRLLPKTLVETQKMTTRTIARERGRRHVGKRPPGYRRCRLSLARVQSGILHLRRTTSVWQRVGSACRPVAIVATHLHSRLVWTYQIGLHVDVVVQLEVTGIARISPCRSKLRMPSLEARDIGLEFRGPSFRLQIRMTLRAILIRSCA